VSRLKGVNWVEGGTGKPFSREESMEGSGRKVLYEQIKGSLCGTFKGQDLRVNGEARGCFESLEFFNSTNLRGSPSRDHAQRMEGG